MQMVVHVYLPEKIRCPCMDVITHWFPIGHLNVVFACVENLFTFIIDLLIISCIVIRHKKILKTFAVYN